VLFDRFRPFDTIQVSDIRTPVRRAVHLGGDDAIRVEHASDGPHIQALAGNGFDIAEFKLSKALLFDGTKPFPPEASEIQGKLKEELEEREKELAKRRKLATDKALITTKAVNLGKNLEKVLPTMKDFK
jgi:hypothetical protein